MLDYSLSGNLKAIEEISEAGESSRLTHGSVEPLIVFLFGLAKRETVGL